MDVCPNLRAYCGGEHGIGSGKIAYPQREQGGAISVRRAIKQALDPYGLMNPARYFIEEADMKREVIVPWEMHAEHLPCSTTVQVSAFVVPTMLIEIDGWAVIPDAGQ